MQLLNQSWNGKGSQPASEFGFLEVDSSGQSQESSQKTEEISNWLVSKLAERLELEPLDINIQKDFSDYGLNSVEAVNFSGDLENFFGYRLPPTLLWDYPTIEALAQYLAEERSQDVMVNPLSTEISAEEAKQLLAKLDQMSDAEVDVLLNSILSEEEG